MAEFCKDCFPNSLMITSEQEQLAQGKLKLIMSTDNDITLCEGCCNITHYVIAVAESE